MQQAMIYFLSMLLAYASPGRQNITFSHYLINSENPLRAALWQSKESNSHFLHLVESLYPKYPILCGLPSHTILFPLEILML